MTVPENIQVASAAELFARTATPTKAMRPLLDDVGFDGAPRRPRRRRSPSPSGTCSRSPRRSPSRRSCSSSTSPPRRSARTRSSCSSTRVREQLRRRHRRRLHHPPPGRGARARRPGHRAARRQAARHVRGSSDISDDELLAPHRRAAARLHLPAEARDRAPTTRRCCGVEGLDGPGLRRACRSTASAGRDRRRRRRRRQRPEPRCCGRWPGSSRSPARSTVGGQALLPRDLLRRRRLHAGRPALRGPDDDLSVRENAALSGARAVHARARSSAGAARSTGVERELASLAVTRPVDARRRLGALRRQPAEGRHRPRPAVRAGAPAWPTSRPRASTSAPGPRSTASCARSPSAACPSSSPPRRQGARGPLRPGARHVARPRRRDPERRRRHRGATRQRRGQRHRRTPREQADRERRAGGSTGSAASSQGDYAPVVVLALVMLALGAYVLQPERAATCRTSTSPP